ncbi:acyl-CoA synthetase [Taibaiella koreensis]|uniref:acyl-CoA synthetase n=1 Tax=Taibaiella koreensis TaxID=1268548 RepID=UPI000E599F02|nr:acyl-CoA synthetase [Taibaiella koreensis]
MLAIIEKSKAYQHRVAVVDATGSYTYRQLLEKARSVAAAIIQHAGPRPGPVLFLVPSGFSYVTVQWGIWLAGGIAVPVHTAHPAEEIAYLVQDTGARLFLYDDSFTGKVEAACSDFSIALTLQQLDHAATVTLPEVTEADDAMMIYTSGTTGKPKGVVISHRQLDTQLRSLSEAWEWCTGDRILNVLPMHHVHGLVNITCCALYNGAVLEMQPTFDPAHVAARMTSGELTLFMAVPTIYHKLIQHFQQLAPETQQAWQAGMRGMRLMVSGSAALPVSVLEQWRTISGHTLLERYGMTEIGMALSNPLHGGRKPGYVGVPLPYVSVQLVDEQQQVIDEASVPGELYVKGDTVFQRYWNRPEETARSFSGDWFRTGDIAERDAEGAYRILGRNSSDIIKSGGYKISALEIENVLLEHPGIRECAVVALPSEEWGETIAAAITGEANPASLKEWLKDRLAPYKIPRHFLNTETLPRNAMGKLLKQEIKKLFP